MSERMGTDSRRSPVDVDGPRYSPFDRVEDRSYWIPELLLLALVVGGLYLRGGTVGVAATVLVLAAWARLKIEFVVTVGVIVFTSFDGEIGSVASLLALSGFAGLLMVDLARTWRSVRPVAAFSILGGLAGGGLVYGAGALELYHLGVGLAVVMALVSYGLYRYEAILTAIVESSSADTEHRGQIEDPTGSTTNQPGRSSDDRQRSEST